MEWATLLQLVLSHIIHTWSRPYNGSTNSYCVQYVADTMIRCKQGGERSKPPCLCIMHTERVEL